VLIGRQGRNKITADDIAEKTGTIPYEVLTAIGERVKRVYKK
jgi:alanine racemase